GELLRAELVPVRGEGLAGRLVGDLEDPARRFAGGHISYYEPRWTRVQTFSTEQLHPVLLLRPREHVHLPGAGEDLRHLSRPGVHGMLRPLRRPDRQPLGPGGDGGDRAEGRRTG